MTVQEMMERLQTLLDAGAIKREQNVEMCVRSFDDEGEPVADTYMDCQGVSTRDYSPVFTSFEDDFNG